MKELKYKLLLFKERFVDRWVLFLNLLRKILMLSTFLGMIVSFVVLVYNTFVCYDLIRVITLSIFLGMSIHLNKSVQE